MTLETLFQTCQAVAMTGWIALALAPLARDRLIAFARWVVVVLAAAYLAQLLTISQGLNGDLFSLAGVSGFFSKVGNVMLGWTHYLAFDLAVGSWEAEDAAKRGLPHWLLLPCLYFTLMLGPIGLLLYLGVCWGWGRFDAARTATIK